MNIETKNRKIKINSNVLFVIKKYIQTSIFSKEAGGVLIGRENYCNNNLIIEYLSEPFPKDKRKHNRFYRIDKNHIEKFQNLYNFSLQIYGYVGEWHTHPEAIPCYSKIDYDNWVKIGNEAPIKTIFYHIISGNKAFRIWAYDNTNKSLDLINTTYWREI